MADNAERKATWNGVELEWGNWRGSKWGRQMVPRLRKAGLSHVAVDVFLVLCDHTDLEERNEAYPGEDTIADEVGCSRRQVIRVIRELKNRGVLTTSLRGDGLLFTIQADVILRMPAPAKITRRVGGCDISNLDRVQNVTTPGDISGLDRVQNVTTPVTSRVSCGDIQGLDRVQNVTGIEMLIDQEESTSDQLTNRAVSEEGGTESFEVLGSDFETSKSKTHNPVTIPPEEEIQSPVERPLPPVAPAPLTRYSGPPAARRATPASYAPPPPVELPVELPTDTAARRLSKLYFDLVDIPQFRDAALETWPGIFTALLAHSTEKRLTDMITWAFSSEFWPKALHRIDGSDPVEYFSRDETQKKLAASWKHSTPSVPPPQPATTEKKHNDFGLRLNHA